jgi:hypothetical protein
MTRLQQTLINKITITKKARHANNVPLLKWTAEKGPSTYQRNLTAGNTKYILHTLKTLFMKES